MSLMEVRNVYHGTVSRTDPDKFLTMNDLKDWVAHNEGVKKEHQLLLTGNSVQLKLDVVKDGQIVYLYDKSLISDNSQSKVELRERAAIELNEDAQSYSTVGEVRPVFRARAEWATKMLHQAEQYCKEIEQTIEEIKFIRMGSTVAVSNLHNHSTQLEKSYYHKEDFHNVFESNFIKTADWTHSYDRLKEIPRLHEPGKYSLADWLQREEIDTAFDQCVAARGEARETLQQLSGDVIALVNQGHSLEHKVKSWSAAELKRGEKDAIMQDVKAVVERIRRDADHVTSLEESPSNTKTCMRLDGLHKREFLSQITTSVDDLLAVVNSWLKQKHESQDACIDYLRQVSQIQYKTSLVRPQLNKLGQALEEAEEKRVMVAKAVDLPFLYGMYLIEQLRRNRWLENMRKSVGDSAENYASMRSTELKQQKSWNKHYGSTLYEVLGQELPSSEQEVPNAEITFNVTNEPSTVSAEMIDEYLDKLIKVELDEPYEELKQEFDDMLRKEERQAQKNMAASMIVSSRPINGSTVVESRMAEQQQMQQQQRYIQQQDQKMKSYVSRIKKLEDLLYREQYNRRNSGDWSQAGTPIPPSNLSYVANGINPLTPPMNPVVLHSPLSPPAVSEKEFRELKLKFKQLEQKNAKDNEKINKLEATRKELSSKLDRALKERDTAIGLKKDLLDNLTNLDSNFSRERRQLNQEISELRLRSEELEEDVEREAEKASEVEARREHEVQRLTKQVDSLQSREREHSKNYSQELDRFIAREHELSEQVEQLQSKSERYFIRAKDLSQKLYTSYRRSCDLLECMGLQAQKEIDEVTNQVVSFNVKRVRGISRRAKLMGSRLGESVDAEGNISGNLDTSDDADHATEAVVGPTVLYWMNSGNKNNSGEDESEDSEDERYRRYTNEVYIDYDAFRDAVVKRFGDVEKLARKSQKYSDRARKLEQDAHSKVAVRGFKEGDLALFLPTRDQSKANNPWAAFNIGAPHFFLKQSTEHELAKREWLVARIRSVEERVVNRATDGPDANPFELSDGLKWHLLEADETIS